MSTFVIINDLCQRNAEQDNVNRTFRFTFQRFTSFLLEKFFAEKSREGYFSSEKKNENNETGMFNARVTLNLPAFPGDFNLFSAFPLNNGKDSDV